MAYHKATTGSGVDEAKNRIKRLEAKEGSWVVYETRDIMRGGDFLRNA